LARIARGIRVRDVVARRVESRLVGEHGPNRDVQGGT
jgi:hypothetical protein